MYLWYVHYFYVNINLLYHSDSAKMTVLCGLNGPEPPLNVNIPTITCFAQSEIGKNSKVKGFDDVLQ